MKPYLIAGAYFDPTSGGQRVLAHLCHGLNAIGQRAYMVPGYDLHTGYDLGGLNIPVIESEKFRYWLDRGAPVVYPEVVPGNPFGAKRVIRWVLAPPGTQRNSEGTHWTPGEVEGERVYVFHKAKMPELDAPELYLTAVEHQWFNCQGVGERAGGCLYHQRRKWLDPVPDGSKLLPKIRRERFSKAHHRQELAAYLKKREWMLCLDYDTFLMSEAGLCGCYSVLPPNRMFTREQYEGSKLGLVGVAWGWDEEEIERAKREVEPDESGQNAVSRRYAEAEAQSREQLARFVEETQC